MKKLFVLLLLLSFAAVSHAQWVYNKFETAAADSFFRFPPVHPGLGTGASALVLSDNTANPAPYAGNAALKVEWSVHSTESWGGFAQMMHLVPPADSIYITFSSATHLKLHYYIQTPSSEVGLVNMRFKLHESGGEANYFGDPADHEDWYYEKAGIYDETPGWKELLIPLVDKGPGTPSDDGFYLPGWSGIQNNGELDFDKIVGYSIEWTTPGIPNNGTATGVVLFDNLTLSGNRYEPITTFDNVAGTTGFFEFDLMGWDPGNQGSLTLTDITQNPFEGVSSLKIDWKTHATQSWGGYVNMRHNVGGFLPDMSERTHLLLFVKVLSAATGTADRVTMRLMFFDNSEGSEEQWYHKLDVDLYNTSDWQMVYIPLVNLEGTGDDCILTSDGFRIPCWEGFSGNNAFDLDKIVAWKFEFSATGDFGPQGEVAEGSILVDLMVPAGFRDTDTTPPDPVTGLSVIPGSYVNLVTWQDVPNETGEKYHIYYSENPITSTDWSEVVKLGVAENVQLVEHLLRAPVTDQQVTYYYAITCSDRSGNVSDISQTASPVTNTAKGVATISLTPPSNFQADGDLGEWQSIPPIRMYPSDGSGYVVTNTTINGDADLSVDAYLAVDNTYLYVAFSIEDDIVSFNPNLASYLNDAPDLFIGLYNWHYRPHVSYQRGAQPDYHIRFGKDRARIDNLSSDSLLVPGADYYWGERFPTGYNVEARIPWTELAARGGDNLFVPLEGMRIPLDFSINDADATGEREGILTYSPFNEDQSWNNVSRWLYTWIGSLWHPVGVDDKPEQPLTYNLAQNYPNPFNPSTQIQYTLERAGFVTLRVFDVLGREVATLVNQEQSEGIHTVQFNASRLSSGIYFYQIESGSFVSIKKMMLVK